MQESHPAMLWEMRHRLNGSSTNPDQERSLLNEKSAEFAPKTKGLLTRFDLTVDSGLFHFTYVW